MNYRSRKGPRKDGRDLEIDPLSDAEVEEEFLDIANVGVRYLDYRALSDTDELNLYAYYKQGTRGDTVEGASPLDGKDAIKYLF
jgi:hypothetical protein